MKDWFVLKLIVILTANVTSRRSVMHLCVSWLSVSYTSIDTTFLSKATDYFSHIQQRWEAKNCLEESFAATGCWTCNHQVMSLMRHLLSNDAEGDDHFAYIYGRKDIALKGTLLFSSTGWKAWFLSSAHLSVRPLVSFFLVYEIKSTFFVGFSWNLHNLLISSIASTLLILEKKWAKRKGKVAILSWKFAFLAYAIPSAFVVRFSWILPSLSISSTAWNLLILTKIWRSLREK